MVLFYIRKLSLSIKKQFGIILWLFVLGITAATALAAWWPRLLPETRRTPSIGEALSPTVVVLNPKAESPQNNSNVSKAKPGQPLELRHKVNPSERLNSMDTLPIPAGKVVHGTNLIPTYDDINVVAAQLALSPDVSEIEIMPMQGKPVVHFKTKYGEAYAVRDERFILYSL